MSHIDYLIAKREKVRKSEKDLTAQIKAERDRLSAERRQQKKNEKKNERKEGAADITVEELGKLKSENTKLRGMIALLLREGGLTYKEIGEKLNCSPSRASQIIGRASRKI